MAYLKRPLLSETQISAHLLREVDLERWKAHTPTQHQWKQLYSIPHHAVVLI